MKRVVLCLVYILFLSHYGFANVYYIATTGNDTSGDGSASNPWRTLKYAVTRVVANQGHTIQVGAGTFIESGLVEVPLGVSIAGAGIDITIIKADSSFYYHPASPGYATDKFLISLSGFNQLDGNQSLRNFTIDGDAKQLHGGIYVRYRNKVAIDQVKIQNTNFTGIWLWDVKDSQVTNTQLVNCSWGSAGFCAGTLNLGNVERVEIAKLNINESTGYGIKAIGPNGYNNIYNLKIHDCTISVNPFGLWNNGSAPNIAIELWQVNLVGCEIYNSYVDNTISLVNSNATPSTGIQTIRVHHNTIDMDTRAHGSGYGVELTIHDAEVDHNYFIKGSQGIANWDNPMQNWSIHHNTFFAIQGIYPGEVVRSQWSGLHNVKLYNNTIEFASDKTMNLVGAYGGASDNLDIRNNLVINSNTGYNYYPNQVIHTENGATISNLQVLSNSTANLDAGSLLGSLLGLLLQNPLINLGTLPNPAVTKTGPRPQPYYFPILGSSLINAGQDVGLPYAGSAPDIGAYEYGATPPPNELPLVNIVSPASNGSYTTGSSVTIVANASDRDGTISKVEFFNGTTKLGEAAASPYSFVWPNVGLGNYLLTAKATDDQNGVSTSASVAVVIGNPNTAPLIGITSPATNSSFTAGSSVTITANATDSDGSIGKVEFFNGQTKLGEDLSPPYSFPWANVPAGVYSLTAKATDNQNAITTSIMVTITVITPNKAPAVSITSPAQNSSFTAGSSIAITSTATDSDGTIAKVEFFQGTTKLGEDLASPYTFTWTGVPAGNYSLTARATDNQNAVTTSAAIPIVVAKPNVPPAVSLTSPVNNASFTPGSSITIASTATDSDGSIAKVEFFNGTTKLGEALTPPYSMLLVNAAAGNYSLTAKATDNQNAVTTSAAISVVVGNPNKPPAINLTSPASNARFPAGSAITITTKATDSDGTISKVEFFNGATKLGEDSANPYSFIWVNAPAGNYSLTAKATDNQNAVTLSSAIAITVFSPDRSPTVRLTGPDDNSHFAAGSTITITAEASDSDGTVSKVEFFNGPTKLGEDSISPYVFVWDNVPAGNYSLFSTATDDRGDMTFSEPISIRVTTEGAISVYPNPATSAFTIRYFTTLSQQAQIGILDMASRLIKQMSVTVNGGQNDFVVDTSGMGNGTYVVSFLPANGQKSSERLIIQGK
jgi:hypothetical protein